MSMEWEGMDALQRRFSAISEGRGTVELLRELGHLGVAEAMALYVPQSRMTGNLGRTIRVGRVTNEEVQLLAGGQLGVGYARHVEFGTRPHVIRPKRGRMLRWPRNPKDRRLTGTARTGTTDFIYARAVNHPGTRPKPYLVPGAINAAKKAGLSKLIIKAWNEAA